MSTLANSENIDEMLHNVVNSRFYSKSTYVTIWVSTQEKLSSGFMNNIGADQPAHPRRLLSAFVIRVLESIIFKLVTSEISIF